MDSTGVFGSPGAGTIGTEMTEPGSSLNGGERRRVSIRRNGSYGTNRPASVALFSSYQPTTSTTRCNCPAEFSNTIRLSLGTRTMTRLATVSPGVKLRLDARGLGTSCG